VFCASIALMSLVPAIFIELNMTEREREEEKALLKQKKLVKRKHRVMCSHLFNICDDDGNGRVSVQEMRAAMDDESTLRQLQDQGLAKTGDFRDIKYGLFDLWKHYLAETGDQEASVGKREFASSVLKARTDMTDTHLWRCITSAHLELHELAGPMKLVLEEACAVKEKTHQTRQQAATLQKEIYSVHSDIEGVKTAVAASASTAAANAVDEFCGRWNQALECFAQKQEASAPIAKATSAGASAHAASAEAALAKCVQALVDLEAASESNDAGKQEQEPPLKVANSQEQTLQDRPGYSEHLGCEDNMNKDEDAADNADKSDAEKKHAHMADSSKKEADVSTPGMDTTEGEPHER